MTPALQDLGLVPFFLQQLSGDELEGGRVARVVEVQRARVTVTDGDADSTVALGGAWRDAPPAERPTVGDWIVLDAGRERVERVLERKSVFKRVAAGAKTEIQLIAANVDTLFVVTSCNAELNESRLERYLALAAEARVQPVVVLTKADLVDDVEPYRRRARAVQRDVPVEPVNALDASTLDGLLAWITRGSTVALVGSSGVGKSTVVNTLFGGGIAATGGIREDDAKGRHTTSHRSLHRLPGGGLLVDVPGMRELKVADLDEGLDAVFDEIERHARRCRFADCRHESEPGCAVRAAVDAGEIDARRWRNYRKLVREDARHNESLAEQHARFRKFGKVVKQMKALNRDLGLKR